MGRWRLLALILAAVALVLAGAGSADMVVRWPFLARLPLRPGHTVFFWLGIACFLLAAWGRVGT